MNENFFLVVDYVAGRPKYYVAERGPGDHMHIVAKAPTEGQAKRLVNLLRTHVLDFDTKA